MPVIPMDFTDNLEEELARVREELHRKNVVIAAISAVIADEAQTPDTSR